MIAFDLRDEVLSPPTAMASFRNGKLGWSGRNFVFRIRINIDLPNHIYPFEHVANPLFVTVPARAPCEKILVLLSDHKNCLPNSNTKSGRN